MTETRVWRIVEGAKPKGEYQGVIGANGWATDEERRGGRTFDVDCFIDGKWVTWSYDSFASLELAEAFVRKESAKRVFFYDSDGNRCSPKESS
ncbi:MAG: hypothetical protein OEQ39_04535 [Gammaproteobacteria bacterium]|nr:hypothetical protein [Gammaproteobacteria bacterium]